MEPIVAVVAGTAAWRATLGRSGAMIPVFTERELASALERAS